MTDRKTGGGGIGSYPPSHDKVERNSWHDEVLEKCLRACVLVRPALDQCIDVGIDQDESTVASCLGLARICAHVSDSTFGLLLHANDVDPEQIHQNVERFHRVCRLLEAECRMVLASGFITEPQVARVFESCAEHAHEGEYAATMFIEAWYDPEADSGDYFEEFMD